MLEEKVTWVHHWSEHTFSFKTTRSPGLRFHAGEFTMMGLEVEGKPLLRAYSIVSPPWADELEWLSVKVPDGPLTSRLQHIQVGDTVLIKPKPVGTLRNEALLDGQTLWLLATGTGLAPFMSLIRDLETLERWPKINIVHSVRNEQDLAYKQDLTTAFKDQGLDELVESKLTYIPIVTGLGDPRITYQLGSNILNIDPVNDRVMICGNIQFNDQVCAWLDASGMQEGTMDRPGSYVIERAFVSK
jgi:ferredoxin--NADP+ reductase